MEIINTQSPATDVIVHLRFDGNKRLFRFSSMTNISLELNSETSWLQTARITAEKLIKAHGEVNTVPLLWHTEGVETLMRALDTPCGR